MWNFEKRVAKQIENLREKYSHVLFMEIRSSKDRQKMELLFFALPEHSQEKNLIFSHNSIKISNNNN